MQLSQRDDDSSMDGDGHGCEDHLFTNEPLLVHSTHTVGGTPLEETVATPFGIVPAPTLALLDRLVPLKTQAATKIVTTVMDTKLADVTPRPMAPHNPSVFVPATPSQNKHKDIFGSDGTDISEPSDDSDVDSMKALSQKLAARTDSLIAITKPASVLADAVSSAGASVKKAAKRRVLDSDNEEALLNSRKGAKGGSKPGASNANKAVPTAVVSDEDDIPPLLAPLKSKPSRISQDEEQYSSLVTEGRPKPTEKNPRSLEENPKPLFRDGDSGKRKREVEDEGAEAGEISDVQEKPPPAKRVRKTAGRKPVTTRPKAVSPAPPRDSQVLKKSRPAAKKNANYGRRTKAARISSPTRDSAALPDDGLPGALDSKTQPVESRVESYDDDDDDYVLSPPKPKPKPKAVSKRKPRLTEKPAPPENPKAKTVKAKAKAQTGTRAGVTVTKAKGADDKKIVRADPPQKVKAKAKRKPKVVSADEGEGKEEGGGTTRVELTRDLPAFIEVSSSPPEPPISKRRPVSRVTSQEVLFQFLSFHSRFSYHCVNPFHIRNVRGMRPESTIGR
jgi:hypothetical protein